MKVIKQIDEKTFVIQLEDEKDLKKGYGLSIAHDYVQFNGKTSIRAANNVKITGNYSLGTNNIYVPSKVQIPIRTMVKTVMPLLSKNKYLKEEHLKDAIHDGKPYVNYSFYDQILFYYDQDKKTKMVSILMAGDAIPTHVTLDFYNKHIKK